MDSQPGTRKPNVSPEQLRTLLAADLKSHHRGSSAPPDWPRRALLWLAVVSVAGLIYIFVRFTAAPSKIVVVNGSGRHVGSVIVISGDQRVDIGGIGNGESRKVDLAPGKPLQIEYTFDERRVWTSPEPLVALQALTILIGGDQKPRVIRGAPTQRPAPR